MRFTLARPSFLVDINAAADLDYLRVSDGALVIGAIARDMAIERASWIGETRWSLLHDVSRVVADPVVRQMATVVGSLCHNDPAGGWGAGGLAASGGLEVRGEGGPPRALAARAVVKVRGKGGTRDVPIDQFLVDSFTTAVGEGELAIEARF